MTSDEGPVMVRFAAAAKSLKQSERTMPHAQPLNACLLATHSHASKVLASPVDGYKSHDKDTRAILQDGKDIAHLMYVSANTSLAAGMTFADLQSSQRSAASCI